MVRYLYIQAMAEEMSNLQSMAARRVMHDERSLDYHIVAELEVQMARLAFERATAGEKNPQVSRAELADMAGVPAEGLRRRFRGEANFTMDDLERLSEALGVEPWAMLKAALMRKRKTLGSAPKRLRDQVIEGPAGLPTIQ